MASSSKSHDIELHIRRTPESVRAWWTDLPDNYEATDPREEPFRIVTLRRFPGGRELLTYWHRDDGSVYERREIMRSLTDGSWTVEMIDGPRFLFLDTFRVKPEENGTHLSIHQVITSKDPSDSSEIPELMKEIAEFFKRMAEICEREAP